MRDVSVFYLFKGFLVSLPFLVVTFVVYAILPVLQNLQGLSIMCYVASLAVSYFLLALGRFGIYGYQSVMCGIGRSEEVVDGRVNAESFCIILCMLGVYQCYFYGWFCSSITRIL
uniref:Putative secreted peptide n=1 Tax=Anopheles braziliensis TaxID=58242 RepID=A0A2M3ZP40_9DIPT